MLWITCFSTEIITIIKKSMHIFSNIQLIVRTILLSISNKDVDFVKNQFEERLQKKLNLVNPRTFSEKIQWLKLFDKNPLYTTLADKYLVREYVKSKVGEDVLNELYGVYEDFENIDFNKLPNSFVIKATHGSGWNIICSDKRNLDLTSTKKIVDQWLSENYYDYGREFVYKDIRPRIVIEKYISNNDNSPLNDYKIFCFNGSPKFIQVDIDRFTNHTRNFYDTNWNRLPFRLLYKSSPKEVERPKNLNSMLEIAKKLSENIKFCRVDLYEVNKKIIFGEITFYPENGLGKFDPSEYDRVIGEYLKL
jgi:hypothetical protein